MMFFNSYIENMIDLHCHAVPYVDDGAADIEDSKEIIRAEYEQGVRLIVMTVHLREEMFDSSIKKVCEHYMELKKWLVSSDMKDMDIMLSREYYCDNRLLALMDGYINNMEEVNYQDQKYNPESEILPFGNKKCILLEFSSNRLQDEEFEIFIKKASDAGLTPIIAHAERYPAVQKRPTIVDQMIDQGAYIQVNCENVLSRVKTLESETAKLLVRNGKADIISSDTHDLEFRSPNLKKCYAHIYKKYGKKTADDLLRNNASFLVYGR